MHNSRSQTEMPQTHYFKDPETHPPQLTPQIQINHVSTLKSKATITQVKPSWLLCSRQFYNLWTRADSEPTQNPPQIAQLVSGTRPAMENTSGKQTSPYFLFSKYACQYEIRINPKGPATSWKLFIQICLRSIAGTNNQSLQKHCSF